MHGAVYERQDDPEPAPEPPPDLHARAAELAAVAARCGALLDRLEAVPADAEALRRLGMEHALLNIRAPELAAAAEADAAARREEAGRRLAGQAAFEAGVAEGEARAAARMKLPRQRGARHAAPAWQQLPLKLIRALVPVAAAPWAAAEILGRHALGRGAALNLTAHTVRVAAAVTAGSAATALVITGAVAVTHDATSPSGSPGGQGAAPAASVEAAVPVPSDSPSIAAFVTRPKAKAGKGKTLLSSSAGMLPAYVTEPAPAPSSSSSSPDTPAPASSSAAGPAALTVSTTAIDLSGASTSAVITLSATGTGFVSWKVDTWDAETGVRQDDLDFSAMRGVLQAGESAEVTVSLDPSQATDGDLTEVFTIGGVSVTAALPASAPQPSPSPTGTDTTAPSPVPSDIPSPGPS